MHQLKRLPRSLLVTQFFGAFNDNAWKLIVAVIGMRAALAGLSDPGEIEAAYIAQTSWSFVVFTLPLTLFSLPAGLLADRLSKKRILVFMKMLEALLMAGALAWLASGAEGKLVPFSLLAAMGLQSALFSPAKYGILPELLPEERLSRANGVLELTTFLAIILGTAVGGLLLRHDGSGATQAGVVLLILSLVGLAASFGVPPVPAAAKSNSALAPIRQAWRSLLDDRRLGRAVMGHAFFWLLASLASQTVLVYAKSKLGLGDDLTGIPIAFCGLGIGIGCYFAGRVSHERIELGLVPGGFLFLALSALLQGTAGPGMFPTIILMTAMGLSGGLIVVPLNAFIQARSPEEARGAVIALANVLVFGATLVGSLLALLLSHFLGLDSRGLFVAVGLLSALAFFVSWRKLPADFIWMSFTALGHLLFKNRVRGVENLPEEGSALIVSNHVSFADWWLIGLSTKRRVRFIIDRSYFEKKLFRRGLEQQRVIAIDARGKPADLLRSLREAGRALEDGDLVCIFAEGQISRTGTLQAFQRGLERMLKGRETPVIPAHIDRMGGSLFTPARGQSLGRHRSWFRRRTTVSFGTPLPATATQSEIRDRVEYLEAEAWLARQSEREALHRPVVRNARRRPLGKSIADGTGAFSKRITDVAAAICLARRMKKRIHRHDRVAVLLPSSRAAALVNLAASLGGRASLNLNPTVGTEALESALEQSGLHQVITSPLFLEKAEITLPDSVEVIDIATLAGEIGGLEKVAATLAALLLPHGSIERFAGAVRPVRGDDLATILFSSGSTGAPKGVLLQHGQVGANLESISASLPLQGNDCLLGSLPFFHSFGTMSFWLAAQHGIRLAMIPNPLDTGAVGQTVAKQSVTLMMATPTFLQIYLRRIPGGGFGSLRLCVAGAERLPLPLAQAFEEKFGVAVLEGYGASECSPVISTNAPGWRGPGIYQRGATASSAGKPIPGVAIRIVDRDTLETIPSSEEGLILVSGPNLMQGYLDRPELDEEAFLMEPGMTSSEPIRWYKTGDIGHRDEQGFLFITDRLSRFSKIGGEMVPHGKVEDALGDIAAGDQRVLAITSLADDKKGEKLVLVHTLDEESIPDLLEKAAATGLPNLFLPKAAHCVRVDELPILGSGKLDLAALRRLAEEELGG